MSERRAIATNIWDDEFVGSLNHFERLLWIGLFTSADDQGRLVHNPLLILRKVFLYDEDITADQVGAAIEKFGQAGAGKVFIYEVKGKKLLQLVNWWTTKRCSGRRNRSIRRRMAGWTGSNVRAKTAKSIPGIGIAKEALR
jgi:hypothetical protein